LHTGFDAQPGSLELTLIQSGRAAFLSIRERLGLPVLESDAVLVAWTSTQAAKLSRIVAGAHANGVTAVRPLTLEELKQKHPHFRTRPSLPFQFPGSTSLIPGLLRSPMRFKQSKTVRVVRLAGVTAATRQSNIWRLNTSRGEFLAGLVINCAGNFGDIVEGFVRPSPFRIKPRKGQFVVFDKSATA
jgi:glycerol-3-phosphate dehydrogenase